MLFPNLKMLYLCLFLFIFSSIIIIAVSAAFYGPLLVLKPNLSSFISSIILLAVLQFNILVKIFVGLGDNMLAACEEDEVYVCWRTLD